MSEFELSNRVYTGSCYSKYTGKERVISTVDRTYDKAHPYKVDLFNLSGLLAGSALTESWDTAIIKAIKWRISCNHRNYVSHPDQDDITPVIKNHIGTCGDKLRELDRAISKEGDGINLLDERGQYLRRTKISAMNDAKSIITGIDIGSAEWIKNLKDLVKS